MIDALPAAISSAVVVALRDKDQIGIGKIAPSCCQCNCERHHVRPNLRLYAAFTFSKSAGPV
jgi:hypothetical protein